MNNRTIPPRTGFGLIAWLEQTRVVLPLKGVECRFAVCGDLLNVEIDQVFHQNNSQALDCLYSFPLPAGAAVYRCEMHVNGRMIRARVEEEKRAREIAQEKKAAGHRTALVEMERENLFTLSLGNLQPNDVIVVRFSYFETLVRLQDWTSFRIPFCPGIRYIPGRPLLRSASGRGVVDDTDQVPDASRISPPRIDALHPDAAYLSVSGQVENPLGQVQDLSSPTHPVVVHDEEAGFTVRLAEGGSAPDRDLVLRWTETAVTEAMPAGWVTSRKGQSFALVRLQAPREVAIAHNDYQQDVYFLVDRSGSMRGEKWLRTIEALQQFVGTLGAKDRVWATFFDSGFQDFAEAPLLSARFLSDAGLNALKGFQPNSGTELLPALKHILQKMEQHSTGRAVSLVLITDGQVGNEHEILHELQRHPNLRLHTFGIDTAVNDALLKRLAAQQHGTCYLITPQDDVVGTVRRLGERLRRPVLTALRVDPAWELAGAGLPDLHAGETVAIPLRGENEAGEVCLHATLPDGVTKTYRFKLKPVKEQALRLLWAARRIDFFHAQTQPAEAIALAKEHNLICEGTAFVAWDEEEKVSLSVREIYQPVMECRDASQLMAGTFAKSLTARSVMGSHGLSEPASGIVARLLSAVRPQTEQSAFVDWLRQHNVPVDRASLELVQSLAVSWQALQKDAAPYRPLTLEFYLVLCQWVLSDANESAARIGRLNELIRRLEKCSDQRPKRDRLLSDWIDLNLASDQAFHRRARELQPVGKLDPPQRLAGEREQA